MTLPGGPVTAGPGGATLAGVDLVFRPATRADSDVIADTIFGDAEQDSTRAGIALFGVADPVRLRDLFRSAWRRAHHWRHTEIAELDGRPVGLLQAGGSSMRVTPGLVIDALRAVGPAAVRLPFRLRVADRVSPPKPAGAFVVSEVHVVAAYRGRGIGGALLERAEARARREGAAVMALHTLVTNPARRLYERHGYVATAEVTDPAFERLTGVRGNVLYVKDLRRSL